MKRSHDATATGDRGGFQVFPLGAVRWLTEPTDVAALVVERGRRVFAAELFHFGTEPRPMAAELYLLEPGRYDVALVGADGQALMPPAEATVDSGKKGSGLICAKHPPGRSGK